MISITILAGWWTMKEVRHFSLSLFSFWILAAVMDTLISGVFGSFVLKALHLEYGRVVKN